MADKKKTPVEKQELTLEESKRLNATKIFVIVFAIVALLGIIASVVIAIVVNAGKKVKVFDYKNEDLSKYVYISDDVYKNFEVEVESEEAKEFDVLDAIAKLLCKHKIKPDKTPSNKPGITISAGDVANIYYRGYTLEGEVKTYFDGGCNFADAYTALEIGSGTFVPGFEYNLIGKNQDAYATMTKIKSGSYAPGDIISLTYSVFYADGTSKTAQSVMIDLSDPDLDKRWGEGFSAYFNSEGREIGTLFGGKNSSTSLSVNSTKGDGVDVYFDMTVSAAYRIDDSEKPRLVVESYFPESYQSADLAGKTGYFEVYILSVQDYEIHAFDETFITDTLKLSAEDLSEYEGASLVEKYKAKIVADINKSYEDEKNAAIEDAFWDIVIKGAEYKKLPESEVTSYYNSYLANIESSYESYSSYYASLDAFACEYMSLSSNADWRAELRKNAEDSVKQRLVFYYILDKEDIYPTDEEYKAIYDEIFNEHLQSYLDYYSITEDSSNYESMVETGKSVILAEYGEEYFEELVVYEYVMEKVVSWAVIK